MKIVMNCLSHAWGGRETCFFDDITEFRRAGHDVLGIVLKDSALSRKLGTLYPEIPLEEISSIRFKYFNPILMLRYYRIIKSHSPDIIHSHDIWTLYTLLIVMRSFPHIPIIATEHLFIRYKKTGLYRKWLYRRLNKMVAISQTMAGNVLDMYPLNPSQVTPIYGGFAFKDTPEHRGKTLHREVFNIPENATVIGMIGRIDPAKGQLELLEATGMIAQKHPEREIFLLVAGRPTLQSKESLAYEDRVKSLAAGSSLRERVKFPCFVESVPDFLDLLDVFIMPSHFEAFGLVLIQAMSRGLPLIATDAGSAREIIDVGKNGFVYPSGDAMALAATIEKILFDSDIESMKTHSRKRFESVFKYDHHLKNIILLYQREIARVSK